jgi:hypothetical protein
VHGLPVLKTPEIPDDSDFATDFATMGRMYILTLSMKTYSDVTKKMYYIMIFFFKIISGKGVETK